MIERAESVLGSDVPAADETKVVPYIHVPISSTGRGDVLEGHPIHIREW